MAVVKRGDKGDAVRDLQADLIQLGYLTIADFDGDFGPTTENAVDTFQQRQGLSADGRVGPETRRALGEALRVLPPVTGAPDVTQEQLQAIMPNLPANKAGQYITPMNIAMVEYGIVTHLRQAAFLGQVAWESSELRKWVEDGSLSSFEKYEPGTARGRALGNTELGDGAKFRGRGPLQLTGRGNYTACDAAIHAGIVANPEAVANDPRVGFQTAGWYWKLRRINVAADARSWEKVTELVNGNDKTAAQRRPFYDKALTVLGASQ